MLFNIRMYVRPILYILRYWRAFLLTRFPLNENLRKDLKVGFIVGCGRSGTTLLGELISGHPNTTYLFEPLEFWRAVEKSVDVGSRDSNARGRMFLFESDVNEEHRNRFNRYFNILGLTKSVVVEKTPHNIFRIGWLERLTDQPLYIFIVRDGVDVAHSIAKLAKDTSFRIRGVSNFNRWWGRNDVKWNVLQQEVFDLQYFSDDVNLLQADDQKGAFEWLVSMKEMDRWQERLGPRMMIVRYVDLTRDPKSVMESVYRFLGLSVNREILLNVTSIVSTAKSSGVKHIFLPDGMAREFNRYQALYGFSGRAVSEIH